MKTIVISLCLVVFCFARTEGQTKNTTDQVIEGGKVVVELIKVLTAKKDLEKNPGCKGTYADLCVVNETPGSIVVIVRHRTNDEMREMVILPAMRECSLQIPVGVWTYDLRPGSSTQSIRKGDLLIEGCQNMVMNIK